MRYIVIFVWFVMILAVTAITARTMPLESNSSAIVYLSDSMEIRKPDGYIGMTEFIYSIEAVEVTIVDQDSYIIIKPRNVSKYGKKILLPLHNVKAVVYGGNQFNK